MPKTRAEFWQAKFDANVARDSRNIEALEDAGWKVSIVWECETKCVEELSARLDARLKGKLRNSGDDAPISGRSDDQGDA
jgi:DNA mismatch endonuclease (patch repair protein)